MPSRYEDAAEKTLHRLQDWGAPATRRTMPIQPSWLHRDPNAMADRIQRDATTKELVAENQQRKVHSGERSRTMGRHHLNPNLHQYQGKPVPQVARMPFFEATTSGDYAVAAQQYADHYYPEESTVPQLPPLVQQANYQPGHASHSAQYQPPPHSAQYSSPRRGTSSQRGRSRGMASRGSMGGIPPLHEIISPPKGEEPYAPEHDYGYLQEIRTINDVIAYYVRYGHSAEIPVFYCNWKTGEAFRPYELFTVPRHLCNPEHLVVSSSGVVHVEPGYPSEFQALSDWMREQSIFRVLSGMLLFKYFQIKKMFRMWRSTIRRRLYNAVRTQLCKRLIFMRPALYDAYVELGSLYTAITDQSLVMVKSNFQYLVEDFLESQSTHRTQRAVPKIESAVERYLKTVERVGKHVYNMEEELRKQINNTPEHPIIMKQNPREKSVSIVHLQRRRNDLIARHARCLEEVAMVGPLIRTADYICCSALVEIVTSAVQRLHDKLASPDPQLGMFRTTASFSQAGATATPTHETVNKAIVSVVQQTIAVASQIPRPLHHAEFERFLPGVKRTGRTASGLKPQNLLIMNTSFVRLQSSIENVVANNFAAAAKYLDSLSEHQDVYAFGLQWDVTAYERSQHDVAQFRKDMFVQSEWNCALLQIAAGHCEGIVYVDAEKMKAELCEITARALAAMINLLNIAARAQCRAVLDTFGARMERIVSRPITLDEFCEFMLLYDSMIAQKEQFLGEAGVVDEMFNMMREYHARIPPMDAAELDKLHDKTALFTTALTEAEHFIEDKKIGMMAMLEKYGARDMAAARKLQTELKGGLYVSADSDATEVVEQLSRIEMEVSKLATNVAKFRNYQAQFELPVDDFAQLALTTQECTAKMDVWRKIATWESATSAWLTGDVRTLKLEEITETVDDFGRATYKLAKTHAEDPVVQRLRGQVEGFKEQTELLQELANPALQYRHWSQVFGIMDKETPAEDTEFSIQDLIDIGVMRKMEEIANVGATASKEWSLLKTLEKMEGEWVGLEIRTIPYKDSGTFVIGGTDEIQMILDDQIVKVQSMNASPYVKPFAARAADWQTMMFTLQDMLDNWLKCQGTWLYLEPIFSSPDIVKQMPEEGQKFAAVDADWREIMGTTNDAPEAISIARDAKRLERLQECNLLLDQIQKGLAAYLEKKRLFFPRFFFLSNDEMLEILSETKDPLKVQPHLKKCFEGINTLTFTDDFDITHINSIEKEAVPLVTVISTAKANGAVEKWLLQTEAAMFEAVKAQTRDGLAAFSGMSRDKWVLEWPGMVVLLVTCIAWTTGVQDAIASAPQTPGAVKAYEELCTSQLMSIVELVRGQLTKLERATLGALVVMDVHARDVVTVLAAEDVKVVSDFSWQCQLRAYWEDDTAMMRIMNAEVEYGYEYLGNSSRLVITPLTDRCYRTLIGAIHLTMGGAPEGPAGTGKTETTKDLAKALARQCVVFNCSDSLDYIAMGKFFKGLASSGAWACFDEFNRIDLEVLSVVAQQVLDIQRAIQQKLTSFVFEGTELTLKWSAWCSITMNPGYAGRSELPDNLKALFRTVAMMVPDYAMISEIILYSYGYLKARECAQKIVATYKLCSEQLSSQDHYDYGMRAVIAVLRAAGNLKRTFADEDEFVLMLRSIIDVNLCKFLSQDVPLFNGIVSDLFPGVVLPEADYTDLTTAMTENCKKLNLQTAPYFFEKTIQLYEMIIVRHGLMLVGLPFSGKTSAYRVLAAALTDMKAKGLEGPITETVEYYCINPKSITMGQLYGQFDAVSHEWSDGVLAVVFRNCASDPSPHRKWIMFDGPVDAIWIENMNTVLDDNKKLCLMNSEIIQMSPPMNLIFEVADLAVASPATVSRCGMVYLEPHQLGWRPLTLSWLASFPADTLTEAHRATLLALFDWLVPAALRFVRVSIKEATPTQDANLVVSLQHLFSSLLDEFYDAKAFAALDEATIALWMESSFVFALVWTIGGTAALDKGRTAFSQFICGAVQNQVDSELQEYLGKHAPLQAPMMPCAHGETSLTVYDFFFEKRPKGHADGAAGAPTPAPPAEEAAVEVAAVSAVPAKWTLWTDTLDTSPIPHDAEFSDLIIPTVDTARYTFLLDVAVTHQQHIMFVGPTGTGKSVYIGNHLMHGLSKERYTLNFLAFSARTSANSTQYLIDAKLDKRKKGTFGPPMGKKCIIMVDDLNMPQLETYGAQPPIELLRQYMDHGGWYDRDNSFRAMLDVQMVTAMGPPGGGRSHITSRFQRHFNVVSITDFAISTIKHIYATILDWRCVAGGFPDILRELSKGLITGVMDVYETSMAKLLPTPSKSHYTFNLRDVSRVVQGMLLQKATVLSDDAALAREQSLRLWIHEVLRVFFDRLVDDEDRLWFLELMKTVTEKHFEGTDFNVLFAHLDDTGDGGIDSEELRRCFFGSYMNDAGEYQEIKDANDIIVKMEEYLTDYNGMSKRPMSLAMFLYAVEHVSRICRVLVQPGGHMLMVGLGGSGRQSLCRLAGFICGVTTFQIEISKSYTVVEWKEDLKKTLRSAGAEDKPTVFLFSDTQIKDEVFVEDINNILNSGEVPNLFPVDEKAGVLEQTRALAKKAGKKLETAEELWAYFVQRCRYNLHVMLTFSPIGDAFRERLRQFPSLINCCTIDWFQPWPKDALEAVAQKFLREMELTDEQRTSIMSVCKQFHVDAKDLSTQFKEEIGRMNYVTPTSYLELLTLFSTLLGMKRQEVSMSRQRYTVGLDKLTFTAQQVSIMQEELTALRPNLIKTVAETEKLMAQVQSEKTTVVEPKKEIVDQEVAEAQKQGDAANAIKTECEEGLALAMPALNNAVEALNTLKPADIKLVQSFKNPPAVVKLVMEAVCVFLEVKPVKVPEPGTGKMVMDFWGPSKTLLGDSTFISQLRNYDKDNISPKVIKVIREQYISQEDFTPARAATASSAAEGLCKWVCAMDVYESVAKTVAPKQAALAEAEASYATVMAGLEIKQNELNELMTKLAAMEAELEASMLKKKQLEEEVELCTLKLDRAEKLINGLGGEKTRWTEVKETLGEQYKCLTGDMLISAGVMGYLGAFSAEYRGQCVTKWVGLCKEHQVPSSRTFSLVATLGNPVKIREWAIAGLPNDSFSIDNGIMVANARRWPLMIDPQGQANKWVKAMEVEHNLQVVKLTDGDYLRTLENAIQFGLPVLLENVMEELDPSLEPLLLKQIFKQGGVECIRLGDSIIEYSKEFKFYITTTMRNPHYLPETAVKVTLLNFMITTNGLADQLLGVVVAEERPDLEEQRSQLVVQSAANKRKLQEIENQILHVLSSSEGNILEDASAVQILTEAKVVSTEIEEKQKVAEVTEKEIEEARLNYTSCGAYTAVLFFAVADMANIDPMYQYSLGWFVRLFVRSITDSREGDGDAEDISARLTVINDHFTFSLYTNVCMSLFERDKLLFAFLLCSRIMNSEGSLDPAAWAFLLTGGVGLTEKDELPNPAADWLSDKSWDEIRRLSSLTAFDGLAKEFTRLVAGWREIYDSLEPHKAAMPGQMGAACAEDPFMKVILLRCIRRDKVVPAVHEFVAGRIGTRFVEPPPFDLAKSYKESSATTPLLFVLSPGSDPTAALLKFADDAGFGARLSAISMGQGQGPKAATMISEATKAGLWVLLQNCHLAPSWMPALERVCEGFKPDTVDPDFRLWMTSYPTPKFPVTILQNSVKMTNEPPTGMRANLKRTFLLDPIANKEFFEGCNKPEIFKNLCFGLAFVHGFVQERRKFGPLGWNIPYGFDDGDLRISVRQLQMFIDENEQIPFAALKYATGECNYGGRVTDDKDRLLLNTLLDRVYRDEIMQPSFNLSASGLYYVPPAGDHASYMAFIDTLPANQTPEVFGLHDNADIAKDAANTSTLLESLLVAGGSGAGGSGKSEERVVAGIVEDVLRRLPPNFDLEKAQAKYPVLYEESMNQVLCQEMLRYNKLLSVVRSSLQNLDKALQGLQVMSAALEVAFRSLAVGAVPAMWMKSSFPCLKGAAGYIQELLDRLAMLQSWYEDGPPAIFWVSGFFFTPAFLTAGLQNFARKNSIPIDEVDYDFHVLGLDAARYSTAPEAGVYIKGLFLEGCGYDPSKAMLCESVPKVLHVPAPIFWLEPRRLNEMSEFPHFNCPVYRTADRRGVLATTGHSTNFLRFMRFPSDEPQHHWILRGVCMLSSLPD